MEQMSLNDTPQQLTREEAMELEQIARSPEQPQESRELAAALLQDDAEARYAVIATESTNASPAIQRRLVDAANRRLHEATELHDSVTQSTTTTPSTQRTVVLPSLQQQQQQPPLPQQQRHDQPNEEQPTTHTDGDQPVVITFGTFTGDTTTEEQQQQTAQHAANDEQQQPIAQYHGIRTHRAEHGD